MMAVSPTGCDPLNAVNVLVNTPMFCPGNAALVLIACLFVINCDDSNVYCRGLTNVVCCANPGAACPTDRVTRTDRKYFFIDSLFVNFSLQFSAFGLLLVDLYLLN